ncbi:MAG: FAD-binding oxidoreductase [Pseudomonadota bacterium]
MDAKTTPTLAKPPADALERFRRIVGPKGWTTDAADMAPHVTDWRGNYTGQAAMVLRPRTTDEVRRIVKTANEFSIALVPQGGNTSLCGASVPSGSGNEIVVSLTRMRTIRNVDPLNYTITVDAGLCIQEIQEEAAKVDRLFPMSFGAEGSAEIGGAISTNAGGVNVLKYGNMRALVLGLEAILPNGDLFDDLTGLRKDNTGYDLKQLLIGAEGTLGIITAATLMLYPTIKASATALAAVPSPKAAVELLALAREASSDHVTSFELMSRYALDMAFKHVPGCVDPLAKPYEWYVLIELGSPRSHDLLRRRLEDVLTTALDKNLVLDGALAANVAQAQTLWRLRHGIPEGEKKEGKAIKHDISVPVSQLPTYMKATRETLLDIAPDLQLSIFGHIGDGNLHYNVQKWPEISPEEFDELRPDITDTIYNGLAAFGGSISAEHGIGQLKRDALRQVKAPATLGAMQTIKTALDPKGIMNPGKVL